jgi:HPt (histidine-containing phosphotransfer) domain-containing protein
MTRAAAAHAPDCGRDRAAPPDDPLAAVRARFRDLIVQRVLEFERLKKLIEAAPGNAPALREVAALAHKISGVAATLGFAQAGDLAAALDTAIMRRQAAGVAAAAIWQDAAPMLETLLDALEEAIDA